MKEAAEYEGPAQVDAMVNADEPPMPAKFTYEEARKGPAHGRRRTPKCSWIRETAPRCLCTHRWTVAHQDGASDPCSSERSIGRTGKLGSEWLPISSRVEVLGGISKGTSRRMDPHAHRYEEVLATEDSIYGPVDGADRRLVIKIASSSLVLAGFALLLLIGAGTVVFVVYELLRT